jgi:hypothetical protein
MNIGECPAKGIPDCLLSVMPVRKADADGFFVARAPTTCRRRQKYMTEEK